LRFADTADDPQQQRAARRPRPPCEVGALMTGSVIPKTMLRRYSRAATGLRLPAARGGCRTVFWLDVRTIRGHCS
jgi:hypothetical protein